MNQTLHHFSELFAQLGLADDAHGIAQFLSTHGAMTDDLRLADAPFWTSSQSAFLRDALLQDADWASVVDQLNRALHSATNTGETLNLAI